MHNDNKFCNGCQKFLPRTDFGNNRSSKDALMHRCRECTNKDHRLRSGFKPRHDAVPMSKAARKRWEKYRLTEQAYLAMLTAQGGRCAICNDPMITPYVDHCHVTKIVRGLLCNRCNLGIGHMKDDPMILRAAIRYLAAS